MGDMTRLLLLLLWVGVTVSTPVNLQKRVIGGGTCGATERQYHVRLVDRDNNFFCGGSLISAKWVLTAAHCWRRGMQAVVGLHPLTPPGTGQTVAIKSHTSFKTWSYIIFSHEHDIMLLELQNPVTIQHIPLPTRQDCDTHPNFGDLVRVAGYGSPHMNPITLERIRCEADTLQCVDLLIIDNRAIKQCMANSDSRHIKKKAKEHWSLFEYPGRDLSPGDSGGGVEFMGRIYGVVSFTFNGTHACADSAGFMDVCEYLAWINEIITP